MNKPKVTQISRLRMIFFYSIAILMLLVMGYATYMSNHSTELTDSTQKMIEYADIQQESFGLLLKTAQSSYINTIENMWHSQREIYPQELFPDRVEHFIRSDLENYSETLYRSLIVAIFDEKGNIFSAYQIEDYSSIMEQLTQLDHSKISRDLKVIGDPSILFGSGDRVFYNGLRIQEGGKSFYVYVAFSEKIMFSSFINTLERETLFEIESKAGKIALAGKLSIFIAILAGLGGGYLMTRASNIYEEIKCPYYQNPMCAIWKLEEGSDFKTEEGGGCKC